MLRPPRWIFGWADRFTDTWGALPAEPIIYFFMFTGMVQTLLFPKTASLQDHTSAWVFEVWRIAGIIAPVLCLIAWYLVNKRSGRQRLMGLWFRLAGDSGQVVSLAVFLMIRWAYSPVHDDAHAYMMSVATGVLAFIIMLVIRDVWILVKVEEIAARLAKLNEAGISPEEI